MLPVPSTDWQSGAGGFHTTKWLAGRRRYSLRFLGGINGFIGIAFVCSGEPVRANQIAVAKAAADHLAFQPRRGLAKAFLVGCRTVGPFREFFDSEIVCRRLRLP